MSKRTLFILLALGAGAVGLAAGQDALAKYEEPDFKVLKTSENIEIRQYPSVIAAEVEVQGTGAAAGNRAFRILAGYIFGKNSKKVKSVSASSSPAPAKVSANGESKASEKIAMTVPVTAIRNDDKMTMRFYMPSSFTLETLPDAIDKSIKFETLPPARYAVIKFSGFSNEDNLKLHEKMLREHLKSKSIAVQGKAVRAFYNPPWTLPFMRRNEIWLPIDENAS